MPANNDPAPVALQQRLYRHYCRVEQAFSLPALTKICQMRQSKFNQYARHQVVGKQNLWYQDNGSHILGVCHLDTVQDANHVYERETKWGTTIFCPRLDDRLGAYTILELLPKLGVKLDWLLCDEEEKGRSSAAQFKSEKPYHWLVEFDRTGSDVVTYDYDDPTLHERLEGCGWRVGWGSFTDISSLEHLGCKAFNVGVAYEDYHSLQAHFYKDDYMVAIARFLEFYGQYKDTFMPHEISRKAHYTTLYDYGDPRMLPSGQDWEDWYIDFMKTKSLTATPPADPIMVIGETVLSSFADPYAEAEEEEEEEDTDVDGYTRWMHRLWDDEEYVSWCDHNDLDYFEPANLRWYRDTVQHADKRERRWRRP